MQCAVTQGNAQLYRLQLGIKNKVATVKDVIAQIGGDDHDAIALSHSYVVKPVAAADLHTDVQLRAARRFG